MVRPDRPSAPAGLPLQDVATLPGFLLRGGRRTGADILERAKNLDKEGATLREIFEETGKDVNPLTETGLRKNPAQDWVFDTANVNARMTPYAESSLSKSGAELGGIPLSTAYRDDVLKEYVPDIWDTPVNMEQTVAGSADLPSGSFTPGGKGISTFGRGAPNALDDPFSQRNIFAHEIQHLLDDKFGMPAGANPGSQGRGASPGMEGAFQQQVIPQAQKLRDFINSQRDAWVKQHHGDVQSPEGIEMWKRMFPDRQDALEQAIYVGGGRQPMRPMKFPPMSRQFEYESTAGEQGARTSQQMLGMTAEQMREESPYFSKSDWVMTNPMKPVQPEFLIPALQTINRPNAKGGLDWSMPDLGYWKHHLDVKR
jgi:hypothetical protein